MLGAYHAQHRRQRPRQHHLQQGGLPQGHRRAVERQVPQLRGPLSGRAVVPVVRAPPGDRVGRPR